MSMVSCQSCDLPIDSDIDVECFVNDGGYTFCENCRRRMAQRGELDVETNTLQKDTER